MGGLKVRNLIATGASQSGGRIVSYINAIAPKEPVFDALVPLIIGGWAPGFDDTVLDPNDARPISELKNLLGQVRSSAVF